MAENNLGGRRCFALVRCSTKKQAGESFPQQAAWLRDFADENQMRYVGELQEALGVSQTQNRPDVDYLLRRAAREHDFDTVLVQDLSRLTRGGLEHGLKLYFKFKEVGVLLASIVDGLIDGEEKLKEAIRRFEEARGQVRASTLNMLRGRIKSRRDGRCAYTLQIPYGIDRLYRTAEGVPLHIIRNLPDGTQLQLDATGRNVLRRFERNEEGVWKHYVKQKDEHMTLVPGAPDRIEVLRRIFRRRFVDGWGQVKIARELNSEGIVSAKGGRFASSTIQSMLQNSIYLGVGIGNRHTWAQFYRAGKLTPQAVTDMRTGTKTPLGQFRPESEWFEQVFPELENMLGLDPATAEAVRQWQRANQKRLAARVVLKRGGDRYAESDFFLRGVLWSKQGGHRMSGCRTKNPQGYVHRYYRVTQGRANPKDDDVLAKMVPAGMLEEAALDVLRDATSTISFTEIEAAVRATVEEEASAVTADCDNLVKLRSEREAIEDQIDFYVRDMVLLGRDGVQRRTEPLRRKLLDLSGRIEKAERQTERSKLDVDEIVRAVGIKCNEVFGSLDGLSRQQVRHLVQSLVTRVVVDLETRQATMDVQMPLWALRGPSGVIEPVCAVNTNFRIDGNGANEPPAIPLASYSCVAQRVKKRFCMSCKRTKSPVVEEAGELAMAA